MYNIWKVVSKWKESQFFFEPVGEIPFIPKGSIAGEVVSNISQDEVWDETQRLYKVYFSNRRKR